MAYEMIRLSVYFVPQDLITDRVDFEKKSTIALVLAFALLKVVGYQCHTKYILERIRVNE